MFTVQLMLDLMKIHSPKQVLETLNEVLDENYGSIAHLGERQLCKLDVVGSSPTGSTKLC